MKYYPAMLRLENITVLVVGGGEVASRKINDLIPCGAIMKVVSPQICDEILELKKIHNEKLSLIEREYQTSDVDGIQIIFAATSDKKVNRRVYDDAKERRIFVNSADDPESCSFIVPSSFSRGDLQICVSTSGSSPAFAALIRRNIEKIIPSNTDEILQSLSEAKNYLKSIENISQKIRSEVLIEIVNNKVLTDELVEAYQKKSMRKFMKKLVYRHDE
jgi:precorrin-2 dehydrogenase/sirohydrochlorin ferrochelatase